MKNTIFILLSLSLLYSNSFQRYESEFYNSSKTIEELSYQSDYSSRDIIKSLIVPGWGQYSRGDYKKAYIFLCIETIAVGIYYNYNKKGVDTETLTKKFGDLHWSFADWITDYYNFKDHSLSYIFEREESGLYKDLWDGGHKVEFLYNNKRYTTGSTFEDFYNTELCPNGHGDCNLEVLNSITVLKDHHYYENIGKYDHFFAGWDDNEEIEKLQKPSGELIAMSPHKNKYRNDWESSAEFNRVADYALYAIYTNHIISLIDLLIFSKINSNSKLDYKLNTIYNSKNKMGIGGFRLSIAW